MKRAVAYDRADIMFVLDERNRWFVFNRRTALGDFDTWAAANAFRNSLVADQPKDDAAPAWTPTSGGY